jgi:hypothetical protein
MIINLHGYRIHCDAPSEELQTKLVRPFQLFLHEGNVADIAITVRNQVPPYREFPTLEASFSTPRNVVYDRGDIKLVDYFGKGATVEDKSRASFTLYGTDDNFLQEAFYLLVLSIFGQYCDNNGMLRVHAMAVSYGDKAFIMPIPSGGGKSTMALAMLEEKGFKLISDDEPVVARDGSILPFALRMGTLDKTRLATIPDEYIYSIDRMEFGVKHFIDARYWEAQLEQRALTDTIYLAATRVLNGEASITPVPKYKVFKSLLRDAILGVGLYQGLEFMLGHSPFTTISKVGTVVRRSVVALKLLRNTTTYRFVLSDDIDENRRILKAFAQSQTSQG